MAAKCDMREALVTYLDFIGWDYVMWPLLFITALPPQNTHRWENTRENCLRDRLKEILRLLGFFWIFYQIKYISCTCSCSLHLNQISLHSGMYVLVTLNEEENNSKCITEPHRPPQFLYGVITRITVAYKLIIADILTWTHYQSRWRPSSQTRPGGMWEGWWNPLRLVQCCTKFPPPRCSQGRTVRCPSVRRRGGERWGNR